MAYDPEARSQSSSAMIIGVVALVLIVGGALAYFSTRNTPTDTVAITPAPASKTVVVNQTDPKANPAPPVIIEKTTPVIVSPPVTKTVETNTTITRDRVVAPPAASPETKTETNVTVNMPKADAPAAPDKMEPNKTTLQGQAGTNPKESEPPVAKP